MKKVRVFKPARTEQKPSTRWPARPSVQREKWRRFAEDCFARMRALDEALISDSQAEGESMNLFDTESLPAPPAREWRAGLIPGPARITDRQVEIMTATLCEVIAGRKFAADLADEAIAALITAMVEKVSRLNEAVAAEKAPEITMSIDAIGRVTVMPSAKTSEGSR